MRNSLKLLPVLLLGSVLGGCSMAGTGDFFADQHSQTWSQSGQFGAVNCAAPAIAPQQQVFQQPQAIAPACGQGNFIQPNFAPNVAQAPVVQPNAIQPGFVQPGFAQPGFVQPGFAQPGFGQPTFVQPGQFQGAFVPPAVGGNSFGLRGPKRASNSYAYGTLGGVAYELGEDLYGVQGRLGYQFNRFLGAEVEGSIGVVDDTDPLTLAGGAIVDQEIDIDTSIAGFGVLRYPLFGRLSGLSRIGYHSTEVDLELTDAAGVSADTSFNTDGLAFGTGLEYALDPKTAIRVDYTVYDFDGPDADALSVAVSRKF